MLETMATPSTICPGCGMVDPEIVAVELGIGQYEFWGAVGYDSHEVLLTRCCEAWAEQFWPEPNLDLIPAAQVV